MPLRLVSPVARSSAMIGAKAVIRLARAERALSAMLGPRWRRRPLGIMEAIWSGRQT
jgi:hypothetical protein